MKERLKQFEKLNAVMKSIQLNNLSTQGDLLLPPTLMICVDNIVIYEPDVFSVSEGSLILSIIGKMRNLKVPGFQDASDKIAEAAYTFQYAFGNIRNTAEQYCIDYRNQVLSSRGAKNADRHAQTAIRLMQMIAINNPEYRHEILEAKGKAVEYAVNLANCKLPSSYGLLNDGLEGDDLIESCKHLIMWFDKGLTLPQTDKTLGSGTLITGLEKIIHGTKLVSEKVAEAIIMLTKLLGIMTNSTYGQGEMASLNTAGFNPESEPLDDRLVKYLEDSIKNLSSALNAEQDDNESNITIPAPIISLMSLVIVTATHKTKSNIDHSIKDPTQSTGL